MNPQLVPSDPSQADPSIVALMAGLKSNEGGTNYNALGDKNNEGQYTAAGIGQWSNQVNGVPQALQKGQIPANFQNDAKQYGLDPNDFSPANQNKVIYAVLADGKINKHLTPEQELSAWNSGDPNKYLSQDASGTGPVGAYNVATYVDKGMKAAQAYAQKTKGQIPQPGSDYNPAPFSNPNPGAVNTTGTPAQTAQPTSQPVTLSSIGKGALGLLDSAEKPFIDLGAAPFQLLAKGLGQKDPYASGIGGGAPGVKVDPLAPTAGGIAEQEAGNAAQVGSYFVPGTEGLLPTIAGAAGAGILQGAGSAASKGENLTDVATQGAEGAGVGAVTGGLLSGAGSALGGAADSLTGEGTQKAIQGVKDAYSQALNLNASERGFENTSGKDLAQVLMDNGLPLGRNADGTLDASEAVESLQNKLNPLNTRADAIIGNPALNQDSTKFLPTKSVFDQIATKIKASNFDPELEETALKNADSLYQATQRKYGDYMSPQVAETLKQSLQSTAFKKALTTSDALQSNVKYLASNVLKNNIEKTVADVPGGEEYAAINKERSTLVDAAKRLTKLDGVRKVKGGSLGHLSGNVIGAITGAASGTGPLGAIAGDYFGGKAADFLNDPATKLSIAKMKLGVSKVPSGLLGNVSKPVGKTVGVLGTLAKKSARSAGLLGNVIANSQQASK